MSEELQELLESSIASGQMSQKDHDRIMKEIHRDGEIDAEESALLSRLFKATQSGELKICDELTPENYSSETERMRLKEEAIARSIEQEVKIRSTAQTEETPTELPSAEQASSSTQEVQQEPLSNVNDHQLDSLFSSVCEPRSAGACFETRNDRLLDVALNGKVWMKTGAMVGYYGSVSFTREGIMEHGVRKAIKKTATGEGASLTKAIGSGNLFLADQGKKITVLDLRGQALSVNGKNILAFEDTINWDISLLKQIAAMAAGGLFNVRLYGAGMVAITTHFDPIVLPVTMAQPVTTDINATVAWTSSLVPQIRTDISKQTLIGRSSGESVQMHFRGNGHVIIQPFEDVEE